MDDILQSSLGYEHLTVQRYSQGTFLGQQQDDVVQEIPVALVYNEISHAVMMATPTHLEFFAKGFSLSEGILQHLGELYALDVVENELGVHVEMTISSRAFSALKMHRRAMIGPTGCGLCGIESLQQLHQDLEPVTTNFLSEWLKDIPNAVLHLNTQQKITALTGGAHAAAWVVKGEIIILFEDVGRHNALDKLLGYMAQHQLDVTTGFVLMTSRASYELVRKCTQLNIALLACISAPTSLAIHMAKQSGLALAAFCRGQGFVLYTPS
ncbi:formate dehydrogenase accessory sulfurtransferase FdhD [Acinetobacter sp. S40]|uniref:formate dehydrogenase accessory sulfurtransferase FdhD n=1 Tax=Acinetobacter sp. S40 TaxID=2767434 RepID=UPI00190C1AAE|nr:formate dehydrogenase accessory sulfurtransferase FdhD [Acinetobacter sp. S40]